MYPTTATSTSTLALSGPVGSSSNPVTGIIHHGDKAYLEISAGEWLGCEEIAVKKTAPVTRWTGGLIPRALWESILSFFEWSMEETKSEVMVQLMYHRETGRWDVLVLPQAGYQGMTVQLLPDHPNRIPTYERLGRGWRPMGSVHHHCTAAAFQSGTDSADEGTKEGVHLTVGGVTKDRYSLHARTSFRELMFGAVLTDWFAPADPDILAAIPAKLHEEVLLWQLTTPPPKDSRTFPEWWKENVLKVARAPCAGRGSPTLTDYRTPYSNHFEAYVPTGLPGVSREKRAAWLLEDLDDMVSVEEGTIPEIWEALQTLVNPLFQSLQYALDQRHFDPQEALDHLAEALEEGQVEGWQLTPPDAEGNCEIVPAPPRAAEAAAGSTTSQHALSDEQYEQMEEASAAQALAAWRAEQVEDLHDQR